ncbi:DUF4328 domain-containing protein [Streptomyces sp. NPDC059564]|uniref:DUF4328 domain-containing protein n=1 Tax=Streptomyces sp. NPDC059564 TaxID=3346865 RepID=UPI0036BE18EA
MAVSPGVPRALVAAVVALLAAVALTDLLAVYAEARTYALTEGDGGFAFAPMDVLDPADALSRKVGVLHDMAFSLCAVVFVAWFHRIRRCAGAFAPNGFTSGPGWAIGAWLVPLANLWRPFRIAVEMWTACVRPPEGSGEPVKVSFWPVNLWWGLFVLTGLANLYTGRLHDRAENLVELKDALFQVMLADAVDVVAAAAAIHFVVRLSAGLRRRAA